MSRTKRATLNWITSSVLGIVPLFVTLILLPKIVASIGQDKYGTFRVISEWIGFTSVFTVAISSFSSQKIARLLDKEKPVLHAEIKRIASFTFGLGIILFFVFGIFLLSTSTILFKDALVSEAEFFWAVFWGLAALLLLPAIPLQGYFEATQRGYQVNLMMLVQRLSILVGSWFAATRTTSLAWQFFIIFCGILLTSLSFFIFARREISSNAQSEINLEEVKGFAKSSFPFMKIDLSGRLGMSADTFLISYIIGNTSVTLFYLALRIPSLLTNQILGLGNSIWAGFLEFYRVKNSDEVKSLFLFVSKLSIVLAAMAAVLVGLFNESLMRLWLGDMVIDQAPFHMVIGLNIIPISLASLWGWLATALGYEKVFARISLESALINISIGILLTFQFGFLGPALGTLIGYGLYQTFRLYQLMQRLVSIDINDFGRLISLPLFNVSMFFIIGRWVLDDFTDKPTWVGLFLYGALIATLFLVSLFYYFDEQEKLRLRGLLRRNVKTA